MAIAFQGSWVSRFVHKTEWKKLVSPSGASGENVGEAQSEPQLPIKTLTVEGTFGSSTVTIEGSNNTATGPWMALNDANGNALTFTANRIERLLENPRFIRPIVTGTGGTADINVVMISTI